MPNILVISMKKQGLMRYPGDFPEFISYLILGGCDFRRVTARDEIPGISKDVYENKEQRFGQIDLSQNVDENKGKGFPTD